MADMSCVKASHSSTSHFNLKFSLF